MTKPLIPDEIRYAFCFCGECWSNRSFVTIEMLAKSLSNAVDALEEKGVLFMTDPLVYSWIDWVNEAGTEGGRSDGRAE